MEQEEFMNKYAEDMQTLNNLQEKVLSFEEQLEKIVDVLSKHQESFNFLKESSEEVVEEVVTEAEKKESEDEEEAEKKESEDDEEIEESEDEEEAEKKKEAEKKESEDDEEIEEDNDKEEPAKESEEEEEDKDKKKPLPPKIESRNGFSFKAIEEKAFTNKEEKIQSIVETYFKK
jgi:cobalamin biosynthesis protein CobT